MSKQMYLDPSLTLEERVSDLISQLTTEEKIGFLHTHHPVVERLGINSYNVGGEGAHGLLVRTHLEMWPYGNSTVFPQPIGLSNTWDADLMNRVGTVIGNEARIWYEKDNRSRWLTLWFPTIDMERDPRWGRNEEAYGEDPYLAGKLAAALIRGVQGDDPFYIKAACAPKHFYGNNVEKDRLSTSTNISERVKQEYYLRVFKYAFLEGKAMSLMTAYNEINGIPCIVNPEVLEIVKGQWGCEGFIVCDGDDLPQTVTRHRYCESNAEAIALAMRAGVDCFTDQKREIIIAAATEAFEKSLITEADIDIALTNILKLRFRLGQFDPDELNPFTRVSQDSLCSAEHSDTALEAARKSVVLLQNDGILPLNKNECGKTLILGDIAEKNLADWYSGRPPEAVAPLDAIKDILGDSSVRAVSIHDTCAIFNDDENGWLRVDEDGKVTFDGDVHTRAVFEEIDWGFNSVSYRSVVSGKYLNLMPDRTLGCRSDMIWGWFTHELFLRDESDGRFLAHGHLYGDRYNDEQKAEIGIMVSSLRCEKITDGLIPVAEAAASADTIIVILGNHPLINGRECFDRPAITFPKRWTQLLERLSAVNNNIILTLIAGYPYAFPEEAKLVRAILYTSHGEQYVGKAVADALFGQYNPGGRLSMTWYLTENDLPDINDYDIINNPRTYMYFDKPVQYPFGFGLSYTTFEYSDMSVNKNDNGFTVSCKVRNTGAIGSDEVVQLYFTPSGMLVKAPNKQLCGFSRIYLEPGEMKTASFDVPECELRFFDENENDFTIIPESIIFMAGSSSVDIRLSEHVIAASEPQSPDCTDYPRDCGSNPQ